MTDQNIDQTLLVPHPPPPPPPTPTPRFLCLAAPWRAPPLPPPPPPDFQLPKYPSGLLTLGEAASLLRVHRNPLRHWEEQGRVSSVRIGARRDRSEEHTSELQSRQYLVC